MKSSTLQFLLGFGVVTTASVALAWTLERHWEAQVTSGEGAAHSIYGTGSPTDEKMLCADCHVRPAPNPAVGLTFAFTPPLGAGTPQTFAPNTTYTVTATLTGHHVTGTNAMGGSTNGNGFAARFETATNQPAGTLRSDTVPASCPTMLPANLGTLPGTSFSQGGCSAIHHRGKLGAAALTAWTFTWTSPAASAGRVTVWWGVVDGDGHENSFDDDSKNGTFELDPM